MSAALTAGRAAPAAGLQICECVLRKIRTQLPGEENSAAAGRGFCSTAAITAGALQQLTAWPRHCSKCCCRLSTWSGFEYDVFTLGFCSYEHISSAEWLKDLVKTKLNFGCLCLHPVFVILCNNCVLTICGELTIIL